MISLRGEEADAPARHVADSGIMVGKYMLGEVIGKGLSSEVRTRSDTIEPARKLRIDSVSNWTDTQLTLGSTFFLLLGSYVLAGPFITNSGSGNT